jgi:hypothetical protein
MDLVWSWVVATGFMLSIILAVCGFVILALVYVVRKKLISKRISQTYYYFASENLVLDNGDLREIRSHVVPKWSHHMWKFVKQASRWPMPVKDLCAKPSVKHWKNRGRYRRNRLATMFFLTMTASIGVSASDISLRQVLNPYAEPGLSSMWIKESLGLPNWQVIVPVIVVPHRVIPAVSRKLMVRWTLQRENERQKKLQERLSRKCCSSWY